MLNKPRLLTPGPTQLPERVRLAMAHDMIHHRKPAFKALFGEVQTGLQELFGTTQVVLPMAASGTGAMAASVTGLFQPGETVLVVEAGRFSERWSEICRMHGIHVVVITVPWGEAVAPQAVQKALAAHPEASGVLMQLSETSTGVQHPVKEVAAITRESKARLVVDGISGVSIAPWPMDAWGIDCLVTGSQKGLMLPPGLALLAFSGRAWQKAETVPPCNFYFNLLAERDNCLKNQTNFTTPVSLIVGLRESLAMFREAGLEAIYRKQWALTRMVRASVKAMGLTLYAPTHFAWGVTGILMPDAINASALVAHATKEHGVTFAAGQAHMKDRMVRFGHMGWVDYGDILAGLHALAASYVALGGFITCRDYLEQGLVAYHTALQEPITLV